MPNPYFAYTSETDEQNLLDDVLNECIELMGTELYYVPREDSANLSISVFGEDVDASFGNAYKIDAYPLNTKEFDGDREFLAKFGLEVRSSSSWIVGRRAFQRFVPASVTTKPREGDLIYSPVFRRIWEIKFVEEESQFYTHGRRAGTPYVWELQTELFKYSQDGFDTGVPEIDEIESKLAYTQGFTMAWVTGNTHYQIGESVYQGTTYTTANASGTVSDWDSANTFLEVINVKGVFETGVVVVGNTSNTRVALTSFDPLGDYVEYDETDNRKINIEANAVMDTAETNPFGMP